MNINISDHQDLVTAAHVNKKSYTRRGGSGQLRALIICLLAGNSKAYINSRRSNIRMGLLKVGVPKSWDDSKPKLSYIRNAGIRQFISTYNRVKDFKGDELLWGDEVEYGIFMLDPETKKIRLSLRAKEIMDELNAKEQEHLHRTEGANWVPEYGAWMVESTPNRPYTGFSHDLLRLERNMRLRRKRLMTVLKENEIAPTVTTFPLLGAMGDDGTVPPTKVGGPKADSEYISDDIINPHPRFGTLTKNIRERRGEKVSIRVPLFKDSNTKEFKGLVTALEQHGCCGGDALQLWTYGKGDASNERYGRDFVVVGCSTKDGSNEPAEGEQLKKWLVNIAVDGCKGLFYRSAPNVIVPDANWPRNGDIIVGYEVPDQPGWIRLQNGYYLPMQSDDGKIQFLHQVSTKVHSTTGGLPKEFGSSTPLFVPADVSTDPNLGGDLLQLKEEIEALDLTDGPTISGKLSLTPPSESEAPVPMRSSKVLKEVQHQLLERVCPAVHMDAMAFGMGCCCLQVTFQNEDVDESRFVYDQIAVLAPILMALTAATPILKGRIVDTDCRWGIISEAVDDRTPAERGLTEEDGSKRIQPELAASGKRRLYKSRYDSISTYIYQGTCGNANQVLNKYNDIPVPLEEEFYRTLRDNDVDPALSQHISHIFARDPLVIFDGAVEEVDDETNTEHFESIQSTNWQSVRWKPPPPRHTPNDPHIGWRTEFRSMEMQLTDFENAAFTSFIVLLTRVILTFDLNLYLPLSRVDANMQRAHSRDAVKTGKFYFRRHLAPLEEGDYGYGVQYTSIFANVINGTDTDENASSDNRARTHSDADVSQRRATPCATGGDEGNSFEEMTMAEIMTGKGDYFPGLIPLVFGYLEHIKCDSFTMARMTQYLNFIEKRALGELQTPAAWMRDFVRNHKAYEQDSVVSDEIAYDLMVACKDIGEGTRHEPSLLGDLKIEPITTVGAYDVKLDSKRVQNKEVLGLLGRYAKRSSFAAPK